MLNTLKIMRWTGILGIYFIFHVLLSCFIRLRIRLRIDISLRIKLLNYRYKCNKALSTHKFFNNCWHKFDLIYTQNIFGKYRLLSKSCIN